MEEYIVVQVFHYSKEPEQKRHWSAKNVKLLSKGDRIKIPETRTSFSDCFTDIK